MSNPIVWHGCYDETWNGLIQPEAFSHPAKFSRALIRRIYSHCLERGYLFPGDTILDPFGGVGLGALDAMASGLNWIGSELEPRFVDLGQGCDCTGISKADWVRFYGRWAKANHKDGRHWCPECIEAAGKVAVDSGQLSLFGLADSGASYVRNSGRIPFTRPHRYNGNLTRFRRYAKPGTWARLVQGDSRRLGEVVGGACGVVSSPPYATDVIRKREAGNVASGKQGSMKNGDHSFDAYGTTPGQLGAMKDNGFEAILTSPPFAGNSGGRGEASRNGIDAALFDRHSGGMTGGMGDDPANLGNLPVRGFGAVVGSPPYANSVNQSDQANDSQARIERMKRAGIDVSNRANVGGGNGVARQPQTYGDSSGQLGAMPEGNVSGVISSPPYSQAQTGGTEIYGKLEITHKRKLTERSRTAGYRADLQGQSDGQLANLPQGNPDAVIGSPPFAGSVGSDDPQKRGGILASDPKRAGDRNLTGSYGETPGQLAGMVEGQPVGGVVSSPPFEKSISADNVTVGRKELARRLGVSVDKVSPVEMEKIGQRTQEYGCSPGQLGQDSGETFWQAARQIVEECYKVLKPGGVTVWVVKNFVRDGQEVQFSQQWRALCEAYGFEFVEEIRAMLVKSEGEQVTLDGGVVRKEKARKSFFRRLAEAKGSPPIDWETVLILRKRAS